MTSPSTRARIALLADRGVVRVAGEDASRLLQGVITADMELLSAQPAIHAALLTPQGKILFDFFVLKAPGGFLLETAADKAADLAKRLTMYKLRAKADIRTGAPHIAPLPRGGPLPSRRWRGRRDALFPDPRLPCARMARADGSQARFGIASAVGGLDASAEDYHAHRIALGVPEGGKDYAFGDTFPARGRPRPAQRRLLQQGLLRRPGGGEPHAEPRERPQARGTGEGEAPLTPGVEVKTGAAVIGTVGSVAGTQALALVRLDRAAEAAAKGDRLTGGRGGDHAAKAPVGDLRPCAGRHGGGVMTDAEIVRCRWAGIAEPIYARYHDEEWGVPHANDRAMFEKLVLEGFQAGLSWLTILKKRENFRRAFHGFDPERIVRYGAKDIARLMADPGIVRNRLKVEATIDNARALLKLAPAHAAVGVPVGLPRRAPADQPPPQLQDRAGRDPHLQGHLQGAEGGRLPLRRPHHDLRLHAVDRHGQRSHRHLPSPRSVRRAAAALQAPAERASA